MWGSGNQANFLQDIRYSKHDCQRDYASNDVENHDHKRICGVFHLKILQETALLGISILCGLFTFILSFIDRQIIVSITQNFRVKYHQSGSRIKNPAREPGLLIEAGERLDRLRAPLTLDKDR